MAIRLDTETVDAQGLPVVTWEEDRNHFAPGGHGPARVSCFIRPDETGVLQFVSVGSVRHGAFEEARPWEKLASFAEGTAEQLYHTATDRVLLDTLAGKSKSGAGRILVTDGARVMLANFADHRPSVPMHLNCADCASVEMAMLHDRLHREFMAKRSELVNSICNGEYVWPKKKPFITYTPPVPRVAPRRLDRITDALIIAALVLAGCGLYWLLGQ